MIRPLTGLRNCRQNSSLLEQDSVGSRIVREGDRKGWVDQEEQGTSTPTWEGAGVLLNLSLPRLVLLRGQVFQGGSISQQ